LAGLIIGACLAAGTSGKAGLSFVGDANVILNANGAGNHFYAVDSYNSPTYSGNILTIQAGQNLLLGGQLQTYPGHGASDGAASAFIHYLIVGTAISGQLNLPFAYNVGNNDVWEQSTGGNMVNLDSSLSAGTYTLQVYFGAINNIGGSTFFDNNSGVNYSATFTVNPVPEPITVALPIFGGLMLTVGLSRRFVSRQTLAV
jgi:hypothetical protein